MLTYDKTGKANTKNENGSNGKIAQGIK